MPIYPEMRKGKKVPGKWRVRIWFKGVKRDWTVEGSKQAAREFAARKRLDLEAAEPVEEVRRVPRFCDFSTCAYATHAVRHLKPSTWDRRRYQIATLVEHFGHWKLTEINTARVEEFIQTQRDRGLEASTINSLTNTLRAILRYAREIKVPAAEPRIFKLREVGKRRIQAWSDEDLNRLFENVRVECPDLLPLVVALANTGMRKGEALALRWRDVDLDARVITIQSSEDWQPKSGKARQVPISDGLLPYLTGERKNTEWVFPCPATGDQWAYWPNRKFDAARKAAGLTGGPHTLRHSYASHMVLQTRDFFLVARLLGHSTSWVTERYAHLLPEHLDRARDALSFGTIQAVSEV